MKKLLLGSLLAVLLLVCNVNAADWTDTVPDETWDETYPWELDLSGYNTGLPGNITSYSIKSQSGTDIIISPTTTLGKFTLTFDDEDWTGEITVVFTATDDSTPAQTADSNEVSLEKEVPSYCDVDDETRLEIKRIDFDDEKYKIGEKVKVTVEDVKATTEDLEDVEVELCLYNLDNNEEIECWESDDKYDIDEDEREDFEFEFNIPNSEDIGKSHEFYLIAYAKGDAVDDGDSQCVQESEEIRIKRETNDVIVEITGLSPSVTKPGETVQVNVKAENIGTKDEEDVYVVLKESILGINLESNKFDLDKYSKSDNTHTVRFMVTIPEDTKAQDYHFEPVVYFDDAGETNSGKFSTLTVEAGEVIQKDVLVITTVDTSIDVAEGRDVSLHLVVTNSGDSNLDATVKLSTIGDWAESVSPQTVNLHPGESNIHLPVTLKEGISDGMYTATVSVSPAGTSEFDVKQSTLSFDVSGAPEDSKDDGGIKSSSIFWIIGDIVLVIIALFFIKAIFFGKKE